jgi:hypothetical protein
MVGSLLAFCPRAATGHAVAAPISVMNSRRLTAFPEAPDRLLAVIMQRFERFSLLPTAFA